MKSIGAECLRPDAFHGVNHVGGMQYQTVLNIALCPELNHYSCTHLCVQFLHKTSTLISILNRPLVVGKGSDAIVDPHHKAIYIF